MAATLEEAPPSFNKYPLEYYGTIVKQIGKGAYGLIYVTDRNYVIKKMKLLETGDLTNAILNEIVYPSSIHHPGIIRYYDVFIESDHVLLIMDSFEGDLLTLNIHSNRDWFRSIAKQLITSVADLTSRNIIHRDIKPGNIFYRSCEDPTVGYQCVLGDFGLATGHECLLDQTDYDVYTLWYRAPEILLKAMKYTAAADVWALGVTLYYLYTGENLFPVETIPELLSLISDRLGMVSMYSPLYEKFAQVVPFITQPTDIHLVSDPEINDLLLRMLNPDPKIRESIFTLQYHPLIADIVSNPCYELRLTEPNQCLDRIRLFDRHLTYTVSISPVHLELVVKWLLELKYEFNISSSAYILAVELMYRYFQFRPEIETSEYQLVVISSLYLAFVFLDYTFAPIEPFTLVTAKAYTSDQIRTMTRTMLRDLNYDLLMTTPLDKILSYRDRYDSGYIVLASDILISASPIQTLYTNSNIVAICLDLAQMLYQHPSQLPPEEIEQFRKLFRSFYRSNQDLRSNLKPMVRLLLQSAKV